MDMVGLLDGNFIIIPFGHDGRKVAVQFKKQVDSYAEIRGKEQAFILFYARPADMIHVLYPPCCAYNYRHIILKTVLDII